MSRPAIRHPEATRAAIIQAAHRLFVEKGFAHTSVSEIAREAGVTQSLIHHHFGSKQELWRQVGQNCLDEIYSLQSELLSKSSQLPGPEGLRMTLRGLFGFLRKRPDLVRLSLWVQLERSLIPVPDSEQLKAGHRLREHLIARQRAGTLRSDLRPEFIVVMLQGVMLHWMQIRQELVSWIHHSELDPNRANSEELEKADEEYIDAAIKVLVAGLSPPSC